ncbi:EAL domain-containing protein [Luteimonas sp. S4-F44]|uniref:bifunctional diguanylate cyclase/phosphodiesterase n=1 Tax=Luteimonas sp. S4-F44 TaxID=2925842 RepID=UPI001F534094|nr:EAL domain-containing protein [Luteimonas sp. S4-F44]UNK41499.1 EAL domain-containing protein [Luteimonas sp. S4-F44]
MRVIGLALGVALSVGVVVLLLLDRQTRMQAADRQSLAMATGVDRLLHLELRNIERALGGIAADLGDDPVPARVQDAIGGVVARHAELASIVLCDAQGRALSPGPDVPDLHAWRTAESAAGPAALRLGGLRRGDAGWELPLAFPDGHGRWLVARLLTRELDAMTVGFDVGRFGSIVIYTHDGRVVSRFGRGPSQVGRRVALPALAASHGARFNIRRVSSLDHIDRAMGFSRTSDYPLVVSGGLSVREVLAPWRLYVGTALALVATYWIALAAVLARLRANERAQTGLLAEIETQTRWLRQAQLASQIGVWRIEAGDDRVRVTDEMAALFGLVPEGGTIALDAFFARMHPDDRSKALAQFTQLRGSGQPYEQEYRVVLPDGRIRWLKGSGATVTDGGREVMTGTVIDITERRDAQMRIERAQMQFRQLFERNPLPAWLYDVGTLDVLAVNEAAIEVYGYSRETFVGMRVTDLLAPEDRDVGTDVILRQGEGSSERTWTLVTQDGRRIEARVHARDIEMDGARARLVLAEDIGARLVYERELAWRASHDPATGMLTLAALAEQLDAQCATRPCDGFSIAYVQLRDLELIAPTLGRRTGEAVLREAAGRFARIAERYGLGGHAPPETFAIAAFDPADLPALVEDLVAASQSPVEADGGMFPLEAWIGLADGPCEDGGAEHVIAHAALAAFQARRGRTAVVRYDTAMAVQAAERLALLRRLRKAFDRRQFELFYQPIQRLSDGRVVAFEALLRWRQDDGSFVPPSLFVPLCEESGLIVPIGAWVIEEAARASRRLADAGADVAIAVNVSAVQFEAGLPADAIRALRQVHALRPGALHLELTESVLLRDPDAVRAQMGRLRDEGACLSIDDFGTGFSSMAYLRELPLDSLKIDRAFVRDVVDDVRSAAICRALIDLGHGLGLLVIAEGVEDAAQRDWLIAHGCDQAQGYHFGGPQPLEATLALLARAH